MSNKDEWQRQLLGAALFAMARTAVEYLTNPGAREETANDVRARLAEVDYDAVGRTVTRVMDQLASAGKSAINEAIDSWHASADQAVEAAAGRAQEQLGKRRGGGKFKLFLGFLIGAALAYALLNEDRRNQIMDRITGASGPVQTQSWNTPNTATPQWGTTAAQPATSAGSTSPAGPDVTEPSSSAEGPASSAAPGPADETAR